MTPQKSKWPVILLIVGAIAVYLHAHPPIPSKPVTIAMAEGTPVEVRLDRMVSSKTSTTGERFSAKLAKPIIINGQVIVPEGTEFRGTVLQAVPMGHLAGGASLKVALSSFSLQDKEYTVQTTAIARVAQGQGRRTAKYSGAGAAIGAAIGALAHGGKGALIGAAAGAGAGAVGSAATNAGHDIVMPAEALLTFRLAREVVVTPKPGAEAAHSDVVDRIRSLFS